MSGDREVGGREESDFGLSSVEPEGNNASGRVAGVGNHPPGPPSSSSWPHSTRFGTLRFASYLQGNTYNFAYIASFAPAGAPGGCGSACSISNSSASGKSHQLSKPRFSRFGGLR